MTPFEKQVVGIAQLYARMDCGIRHGNNWRLPCPNCVEYERELLSLMRSTLSDEHTRYHTEAGHDARDGNTPWKKKPSG